MLQTPIPLSQDRGFAFLRATSSVYGLFSSLCDSSGFPPLTLESDHGIFYCFSAASNLSQENVSRDHRDSPARHFILRRPLELHPAAIYKEHTLCVF